MRILLVAVAFVAVSLTAFSQSYIFDKGSMSIAGGVGFSSMSSGGSSVTSLYLSPTAGFFVIRNLEVGASLSITSFSGSGASTSSTFIGPYARYYFTEGRPILAPFLGAGLGITSSGGASSTGITLTGGAAYVVAKNVTIDGALYFRSGDVSTIGLAVGVGVFIW
ncbi:MAG: hypothetical protein JNJ85_08870 [Candidatus Kapabacteria bacterium]|nr:hypothetical protein [Candidatus Kapabacteria bacterium]